MLIISEPINFDQQGEDYGDHQSESSKASAIRGHNDEEPLQPAENEALKNALNEQCGMTPVQGAANSPRDSPHLSPNHRRGSVNYQSGHRLSICTRKKFFVFHFEVKTNQTNKFKLVSNYGL